MLRDAINNVIELVEHADSCLVYDRPLTAGLSWGELVSWRAETSPVAGAEPARSLYARPGASLGDPAEEYWSAPTGRCTPATATISSER